MPDQNTMVAPTRQFAEFAAELTYGRLPANVREALTIFMLDYLRVASLGREVQVVVTRRNIRQKMRPPASQTLLGLFFGFQTT